MKSELEKIIIRIIKNNPNLYRKQIVQNIFSANAYNMNYIEMTIDNLVLDGVLSKFTKKDNRRKVFYEVAKNDM